MKLIRRFFILALASIAIFPCANAAKKQKKAPEPEVIAAPVIDSAPVAPFGDTLFFIYGGLGGIPVEKRAEIISENIVELEKDPFFEPDSLMLVVDAEKCNLRYRRKVVFSLTRRQAEHLEVDKSLLSDEYCETIIGAITEKRSTNLWLSVLIRLLEGMALVAGTYFCIKYLNVLYRKTAVFVGKQQDKTIKNLYHLLDADKQISLLLIILKFVRLLLIVLVFYLCLLILFRLLPATRWLSDTLLGYITTPLRNAASAVWNYIPDLMAIIVIIFIFRYVIKSVRIIADRIGSGAITINGFHPEWSRATFNIIRAILFVFMFIFIFPHLPNSDSSAFQGVSVFVGVLLSMGSTSIIGNLVAGLVITYMRPFKIGDRIKMGETVGNVIEKSTLVTRIKTPKNEVITIPNSNVMSAQTINYTSSAKEHGLILHTAVTMGYDFPWRKMHELLIEAGLKTNDVLQSPKPFVLQTALDDFYVQYEINIYIENADAMSRIYSDLNKNIQDIFGREQIELMAPHFYAQRPAESVILPPIPPQS